MKQFSQNNNISKHNIISKNNRLNNYFSKKDNIILDINNLEVFYGPVQAIFKINLKIAKNSIVSIIGSNGAGKTTTLKAISGLVNVHSGTINFNNKNITNFKPHKIVNEKIILCPEGRRIFNKLSVKENLLIGSYSNKKLHKNKCLLKNKLNFIFELFPRLYERQNQIAGTLSGGEQQMLAIGRALMADPELLMLDEPSLGLAPNLVQQLFKTIKTINNSGITILLIEQNVYQALKISDYSYILTNGVISTEGVSNELLNNMDLKKKYFGHQ